MTIGILIEVFVLDLEAFVGHPYTYTYVDICLYTHACMRVREYVFVYMTYTLPQGDSFICKNLDMLHQYACASLVCIHYCIG